MKKEINKDYFLALKYNPNINKIEKREISTFDLFEDKMNNLLNFANDDQKDVVDMVNFIKDNRDSDNNNIFWGLQGEFKYCQFFNLPYQGMKGSVFYFLTNYKKKNQSILESMLTSDDEKKNQIKDLKQEFFLYVDLWIRAYYSKLMFEKLLGENEFFVFSHREKGWSNPEFALTDNFKVEIKTNFGYGLSSYFYTILTYKNLKIVPFSDWIEYRYAHFHEIIRYTKKHALQNYEWENVINFSFNACNLSLENEILFVKTYIVDEIESLINGLISIFNKSSFFFKRDDGEKISVDINGYYLISFRGEKIVGSLDFISTLLEFNDIIEVGSYIKKILRLNSKILPILKGNLPLLYEEIKNQESKLFVLDKPYENFKVQNKSLIKDFYNKRHYYVQSSLSGLYQVIDSQEKEDREINKLEEEFLNSNSTYLELYKRINEFEETRKFLNDEVQSLKSIKGQMERNIEYCEKVLRQADLLN